MLGKTEIDHLRRKKDLLVLQSEANRLVLMAEWKRVRSPEAWSNQAIHLAKEHPIWTTALAVAAGALAAKSARRPGAVVGGLGRISRFVSLAFAVWGLFKKRTRRS